MFAHAQLLLDVSFCRPWRAPAKILLFLNELEEVLELTHPPEFGAVVQPLLRVLARCMQSLNVQVAERALQLWNNQYFMSLVAQRRDHVFPLVHSALRAILNRGAGVDRGTSGMDQGAAATPRATKNGTAGGNKAPRWNGSVNVLATSLLEVLAKMDPSLFALISAQHEAFLEGKQADVAAREARWKCLADQVDLARASSPFPRTPPQVAGLGAVEC